MMQDYSMPGLIATNRVHIESLLERASLSSWTITDSGHPLRDDGGALDVIMRQLREWVFLPGYDSPLGRSSPAAPCHVVVFSVVLALAEAAEASQLAYRALRELQNREWGDVAQAASSIGLLSLGEGDVNLACFPVVFGQFHIPDEWVSREKTQQLTEGKFWPHGIPDVTWKNAFSVLRTVLKPDDEALRTLLGWACKRGVWMVRTDVFVLAAECGLHTPFVLRCLSDRDDLTSVAGALRRVLESDPTARQLYEQHVNTRY